MESDGGIDYVFLVQVWFFGLGIEICIGVGEGMHNMGGHMTK